MKKPDKRCKTCRWYDAPPKAYHAHAYPCRWPFPADFAFPESMSPSGYNSPIPELRRPIKGRMRPSEGTNCACWEPKAQPTDEVGAVAEPEGRSA